MAKKTKFTTKWEHQQSTGTIQTMDHEADCADQTRADETEIKKMIEKYGILPLQSMLNAKEPIFLNCFTGETTEETYNRIEDIKRTEEYFNNLPANVRKQYGDDYRNLWEDLQNNKFQKAQNLGIMENEQVESYLQTQLAQAKNNNKIEELQKQIDELRKAQNEQQT